MFSQKIIVIALFLVAAVAVVGGFLPQAQGNTSEELALRQEQIADKFSRLENLMLKMADLDASNNPRRAMLLRRAVSQANQRHLRHQLQSLIGLLSEEQLEQAVEHQRDVHADLKALLELLLSENRSKRLQNQQSRVRSYIKELERLLRRERALQARTEGGGDALQLGALQKEIAERTGRLDRQMKENEEGGSPPSDDRSTDGETNEEDSQQGEPRSEKQPGSEKKDASPGGAKGNPSQGESEPQESEPGESDSGKSEPGEKSGSGKSPPDSGQPPSGDSQSSPSKQPSQESFRPRRRVHAAEKHMQDASENLHDGQREKAVGEQEKAQQELRKALAELEEILRQMREEEIERVLAMLETRLKRMLAAQRKVYEATVQLDKTTGDKRAYEVAIQAGDLSFGQRKIVVEADRALTLLHEEGSSIAFPEVVGQARDDMEQVVERLAETKIGTITQGLQIDIIAALEEMIEALQREQQKREKEKNQQPQPMAQQSQDESLVDSLAELKMIRSMQDRVYRRTKRYAELLDNSEDLAGQALDQELHAAIRKLSQRQQRIHEITRDLVLGKNR